MLIKRLALLLPCSSGLLLLLFFTQETLSLVIRSQPQCTIKGTEMLFFFLVISAHRKPPHNHRSLYKRGAGEDFGADFSSIRDCHSSLSPLKCGAQGNLPAQRSCLSEGLSIGLKSCHINPSAASCRPNSTWQGKG